jgi:hypothetical protein
MIDANISATAKKKYFSIKEIQMSKYDEFFPRSPRKPFGPTPWLIVVIIVLSVALTSIIDNCGRM